MKSIVTAMLAGAAMAFSLVTAAEAATGSAPGPPARSRPGRSDFPVPLGLPSNLYDHTIRQVARVSIGGSKVRIVVSNEYGKVPLKIGAAHIGAHRRRPRPSSPDPTMR